MDHHAGALRASRRSPRCIRVHFRSSFRSNFVLLNMNLLSTSPLASIQRACSSGGRILPGNSSFATRFFQRDASCLVVMSSNTSRSRAASPRRSASCTSTRSSPSSLHSVATRTSGSPVKPTLLQACCDAISYSIRGALGIKVYFPTRSGQCPPLRRLTTARLAR